MTKRDPRHRLVALGCILAACGDDDHERATPTLGEGEGQLDLLCWPGYAEDGTTDPSVDWVSAFEEATGCQVNVTLAGSSQEMRALLEQGSFDAVSASGDLSVTLMTDDLVAPLATELIPSYGDLFPDLTAQAWNSAGGDVYGVPIGRGANVLVYNTESGPAPDSWSVVFESDSPYAGKVSIYDSPIYIADAALYLMATRPELGIRNPYALDRAQLDAAVALLSDQKAIVGQYWIDFTKQIEALSTGDVTAGTSWQIIVNLAVGGGATVASVKPREGATGWSDSWMIPRAAKHPNCAYRWLEHYSSPATNATVAEYFGMAPSSREACAKTVDPNHCAGYHASDEAYWRDVWYWRTPQAKCADGRTVTCTTWPEWQEAWDTVRAASPR